MNFFRQKVKKKFQKADFKDCKGLVFLCETRPLCGCCTHRSRRLRKPLFTMKSDNYFFRYLSNQSIKLRCQRMLF